ncbi:uncharacterized protein BP5553_07933 [Venustampulla echinocandica]|uniref:Rhodopsin domain-containing protein n=1 Tax=Venustampulla echinocandica TaxID=2656787 RepID=A0A370THX9_9HELO|nr:uncharacterized protein BP5553_07933 [Venustampulla echinocandica]RDL34805.1 hypothetical protein BP5553_07933 [Venustampulla echinocandica]
MSTINIPLETILLWPKPTYIDPVTRGHGLAIVSAIFLPLTTVITALRLYSRLRITANFGAEDVLIILAQLCAYPLMISLCYASLRLGWNRHVWDVPLTAMKLSSQLYFSFQITVILASSFTKLSVMWFCRRVLVPVKYGLTGVMNYVILASMAFVSIYTVVFCFYYLFQCWPIYAYWDIFPTYPHKCIKTDAGIFATSIIHTLTDLLVTLIPMPLLATLRIPRRQKIAVMSLFGLGVVVNIAGALRTYFLFVTMQDKNGDMTWNGWPTCIVTVVEIGVGLVAASGPALRPLIAHHWPSLFGSTPTPVSNELNTFVGSSQNSGQKYPIVSVEAGHSREGSYRPPYMPLS